MVSPATSLSLLVTQPHLRDVWVVQACEFSEFTDARQYDALVGRFILMYLPDPGPHLAETLSPAKERAFVSRMLTGRNPPQFESVLMISIKGPA